MNPDSAWFLASGDSSLPLTIIFALCNMIIALLVINIGCSVGVATELQGVVVVSPDAVINDIRLVGHRQWRYIHIQQRLCSPAYICVM